MKFAQDVEGIAHWMKCGAKGEENTYEPGCCLIMMLMEKAIAASITMVGTAVMAVMAVMAVTANMAETREIIRTSNNGFA